MRSSSSSSSSSSSASSGSIAAHRRSSAARGSESDAGKADGASLRPPARPLCGSECGRLRIGGYATLQHWGACVCPAVPTAMSANRQHAQVGTGHLQWPPSGPAVPPLPAVPSSYPATGPPPLHPTAAAAPTSTPATGPNPDPTRTPTLSAVSVPHSPRQAKAPARSRRTRTPRSARAPTGTRPHSAPAGTRARLPAAPIAACGSRG